MTVIPTTLEADISSISVQDQDKKLSRPSQQKTRCGSACPCNSSYERGIGRTAVPGWPGQKCAYLKK
jgi:hypothetical protein